MVGDRITYAGFPGVVAMVLVAGTQDAANFACPDTGGILMEEDQPHRGWSAMVLTPPDGRQWEDLDFIERAPST